MSTDEDGIGGLSSVGRTRILAETRFTASEVDELWYRTGARSTMDSTNFDNVLVSSSSASSSNNEVLLNRLWDMFDSNDSGDVEFIIALGSGVWEHHTIVDHIEKGSDLDVGVWNSRRRQRPHVPVPSTDVGVHYDDHEVLHLYPQCDKHGRLSFGFRPVAVPL